MIGKLTSKVPIKDKTNSEIQAEIGKENIQNILEKKTIPT